MFDKNQMQANNVNKNIFPSLDAGIVHVDLHHMQRRKIETFN